MSDQPFDMTEHIRQSNLIENITDPAEVTQSLRAWQFLCVFDQLTHPIVHGVHSLVVRNQTDLTPNQKGAYRSLTKVNVAVGNHIPPGWQHVDRLMTMWLNGLDNRSAWENHVEFERIHPFVDGNGRVGRLLMWWQQGRDDQEPLLLEASKRHAYYRSLSRGSAR